MDNQLEWQKVRSEPGPDLGILSVRFDWLKHPTEDRTLKRLVLESGDWINVVALTEDGKSVMGSRWVLYNPTRRFIRICVTTFLREA